MTTPVAPTPPPATIPTQIVLGLLGLFGYNPYATPNPATPPPAPILEQLWAGWQQINRRLFNSHPTVNPTVTGYDPTTGTITGTIGGFDPDGDTMQYTATSPTHGTVTIDQKAGTFTYTPSAAYTHSLSAGGATTPGSDSITFSATDDLPVNGFHLHLLSATDPSASSHAVTVAVLPVNSAPTGSATGTLNTTTGVTTYVVTTKDNDGDPVAIAVTTAPTAGDLKAVNGSYVYTPTKAAEHAAAGGGPTTDSAVLTLTDGHGGTSTLTLAPTIVGTNTPPTITAVSALNPAATAAVPVSSTISVSTGDNEGDPVTVTVQTAPTHGTLTQTSDTTWLYEPTRTYAHGLTATGSDSVTFQATDGHGGVTYVTVPIAVPPQNQNPVGMVITTTQTSNTRTTYEISVSDADGDTVTQTVTTGPSHGTYDVSTGVYDANPDYAHGLSAGGSTTPGTDQIVLTLGDGHGGTNTITLTPTILPVNTPPQYVLTSTTSDLTTNTTTWTVTVTDSDTLVVTPSTPSHGTVTVTPTGTATTIVYVADTAYAQSIHDSGTDSFTVTFDDQHGGVVTQTYTPTILPVNLPPTIGVTSSSTTAGSVTTYVITTGDPNGDGVTVAVETPPKNGTVQHTVDGWVYTPTPGYPHALSYGGSTTPFIDSFTLVASDGRGGTTSLTLTPTVTPVNAAPTGSLTGTLQTDGTTLILGNPSDPDGDSFDFGVTTPPQHGTISAGKGGFIYRPDPLYVQGLTKDATDSVVFTADDHRGGVNTYTVPLTITAPAVSINVVSSTGNTSTYVVTSKSGTRPGAAFSSSHGIVDLRSTGSGFELVFTADSDYAHSLSVNGSTTPGEGTIQGYLINGVSVPFVLHPTITPVNIAPTLTATGALQDNGTTLITTTTTDADNDPVTVTVVGSPAYGTVVQSNGKYVYTPYSDYAAGLAQNGTDTVRFSADDGHGGITSGSLDVTIVAQPGVAVTTASTSGGSTTYVVSSKSGATPPFSIVSATNGTVTTTPTGFVFTPDPTYAHSLSTNGSTTPGSGTVVVSVVDGANGPRQFTVTPTVTPTNTKPTLSVTSTVTVSSISHISDPFGLPITQLGLVGGNQVWIVDTDQNVSLVDFRTNAQLDSDVFDNPPVASAASAANNIFAIVDTTGRLIVVSGGNATMDKNIGLSPVIAVARGSTGAPFIVAGQPSTRTIQIIGLDGSVRSIQSIAAATAIAVSPDGKTVYVADPTGLISAVDVTSGTSRFFAGTAPITSMVVSPDGKTLYVGTTVQSNTYNAVTGSAGWTVTNGPNDPALNVTALALTPDSRYLFMGTAGSQVIQIRDPASMAIVGTTPALGFTPSSIQVTPDGHTVVASGQGQAVLMGITPAYRATTSDADKDAVSVVLTGMSGGIASPYGNGTFAFTPIGSPSSFTLTANDGHGGSTSVTTQV